MHNICFVQSCTYEKYYMINEYIAGYRVHILVISEIIWLLHVCASIRVFFFNILEQIVTTQSDIPDQASYVMEVKVYDDCRLTQTGTVTLTVPNTVNYTIIRRTQNILDSWKNKTLQPAQSLSRILVHQKPLFQS